MQLSDAMKRGWVQAVGLLALTGTLGAAVPAHAADGPSKLRPAPLPIQQPSKLRRAQPPAAPAPQEPGFVLLTRLERRAGGKLVETRVGKVLRETHVLDIISKDLNNALKLKRQVIIRNEKCGEENAFYDPASSSLVLCDEYLDLVETLFASSPSDAAFQNAVLSTLLFTMLHETGHALVDQFQLPFLGREEDAVDAFATYLLTYTGFDDVALTGADSFVALSALRKANGRQQPLWDSHSLDEQRVYNILCLVYGSNPGRYAYLVQGGYLPEERAGFCPRDYQRTATTLSQALAPHLRTTPAPAPAKLTPLVRTPAP